MESYTTPDNKGLVFTATSYVLVKSKQYLHCSNSTYSRKLRKLDAQVPPHGLSPVGQAVESMDPNLEGRRACNFSVNQVSTPFVTKSPDKLTRLAPALLLLLVIIFNPVPDH